MVQLKTEFIHKTKDISLFGRGKDVLTLSVYKRIFSKDSKYPWYVNDFSDIGNTRKIRSILIDIESKGYIKKIKSNPVFWVQKPKKS